MTAGTEYFLEADDLAVTFRDENGELDALEGVSFGLRPHEFVCLLGSSGSGKTTLLNAIAGLQPLTGGEIRFASGSQPRTGLVFQDANLMPWRTVLENITLPLELEGVAPAEAAQKACALINLVGLNGFEENWPSGLSGGMAQRVAIARALIQQPDLLLLDEPFGALDALTREQMWQELLRIWGTQRQTVLMVTHSISEALLLSDRVLVLTPRPGRVCLDLPVALPRPRCNEMRYTAKFGEMAKKLKATL
ncbi:MAG: ABC transporter ATP-binding protein [Anaerolineaceae bacterium]|jgi:NitT/TauT family transport system ATP-binding protein|nr:ABC transporter ATP-binding protein [Anaerolineaceae bacterium]